MQKIDGKITAAKIKEEIAAKIQEMVAAGGRRPNLVGLLVGHDGGSESYMMMKTRACEQCGIRSSLIRMEPDVTQEELISKINELNRDNDVDGFIVQLPLPKHIDEQAVVEAIDYRKDVDGFHPINVGRLAIGLPCFKPATPSGVLMLLEHYCIETRGKHCVILGRSNIVGKPLANMLVQKAYPGNCTVTVCHSATPNINEMTRQADILIAAMGSPGFVTEDMVKEGAVVIDVGTTRVPDATRERGWRLCGDVDFATVSPHCSFITPVPGGVGPMTIVSLLHNTLLAATGEVYKK
ncbi:MAG: bifunctional 5,10-methylene-tetrahydrofolate dehydrogenase/5,10-methylene-tetrahydrofolate cyclohydrolase [Muribaculaceae bacterium]|nr:bifunctional 5,10-methylene-tetrahydrofolate dehydrogenase/5,10-methylene-tetrahydrofolate cyclohydrolase [Muribaculaceae bacterium]